MPNKAAAGRGNIRKVEKVKNGKTYTYWEGRLSLGFGADGKRKIKSFSGATQREVRDAMDAALHELREEGHLFEPTKMSVKAWLELWLAEYQGDKKYGTTRGYKSACNTHIIPVLGNSRLADLRTPQIQKFYNDLLRGGKSPKTVRNIHGVIIKALNTAVDIGYLRTNPAAKVTLPKVQKKEMHVLSDEQAKAFVKAAEQDSYGNLLKTILFVGLREAEAIGLTWDCIDLNAGTLKVNKQLQKRPVSDGGFTFVSPKNGKTRIVRLSPPAIAALKARRAEQAKDKLLVGDRWRGEWKNDLDKGKAVQGVFTNSFGEHLHPQTVYNHYKAIANAIGAPDTRVHDLRHTYATQALQSGVDIKTLSANLGHADVAFTLSVYGHVSEQMEADAAAKMGTYWDHLLNGTDNL